LTDVKQLSSRQVSNFVKITPVRAELCTDRPT